MIARVVDIDAQDLLGAQDAVQQPVDHPAMAEHRDRVLVVAHGHQVAYSRVDPSEKSDLVNAAGQVPVGQSRPLLGELGGDLLDWDVVLHVSVILGEAFVDLDAQPQGIGNRLRGLHERRCGLLTSRVIGKRASASGSLSACSMPSADRSGSEPCPGSLRSGNACRTSSNCISIPTLVTYSARATIDAVRAFACPVCNNFAPFESAAAPPAMRNWACMCPPCR